MIGVPLKMTLLTDRITVQKNELCLFVCVRTGWFSNLCLFVCFSGPVPATVTTLSQAASRWPLPARVATYRNASAHRRWVLVCCDPPLLASAPFCALELSLTLTPFPRRGFRMAGP